jgi:ATP-dependent DNA ligase
MGRHRDDAVLCPPVPPMVAKAVDRLPAGPGWSFEPKLDGFRAVAFIGSGSVFLQSRQLRDLTAAFPDVAAGVAQLGEAVVDGELVIWRGGRCDFAALQQRLHAGRPRVGHLAASSPASFVVFDLLFRAGRDLHHRPYATRRRKLTKLLDHTRAAGVVLAPATEDPTTASTWMRDYSASGIEGVVAKRQDQPYRPGVRGWQKLRTRVTADAVVGGIIGPLAQPRALLLGRYHDGRLRLVARSTTLAPAASRELGRWLRPAAIHPWPEVLPPQRFGHTPTSYTRVIPDLVVELSVDLATEGLRWRHPARLLRLRTELTAIDLGATSGEQFRWPAPR